MEPWQIYAVGGDEPGGFTIGFIVARGNEMHLEGSVLSIEMQEEIPVHPGLDVKFFRNRGDAWKKKEELNGTEAEVEINAGFDDDLCGHELLPITEDLRIQLKESRLNAGMKQTSMAKAIRASQAMVSRIESDAKLIRRDVMRRWLIMTRYRLGEMIIEEERVATALDDLIETARATPSDDTRATAFRDDLSARAACRGWRRRGRRWDSVKNSLNILEGMIMHAPSQAAVARHLGVRPETLSRQLKKLRGDT
jgi:DNA-binding XRE family transcriptional regulator